MNEWVLIGQSWHKIHLLGRNYILVWDQWAIRGVSKALVKGWKLE